MHCDILEGVTIYMYVDIFKVPNFANRHLIFMKPNLKMGQYMTLVEDSPDKNLYLQYLHNCLHYIRKGKSKCVHHSLVCVYEM